MSVVVRHGGDLRSAPKNQSLPQCPSYRNCSDTWWWFHSKSLKRNKTKQKTKTTTAVNFAAAASLAFSILISCSSISPKRSVTLPVSLSNPSVNSCHNREAVAASCSHPKAKWRQAWFNKRERIGRCGGDSFVENGTFAFKAEGKQQQRLFSIIRRRGRTAYPQNCSGAASQAICFTRAPSAASYRMVCRRQTNPAPPNRNPLALANHSCECGKVAPGAINSLCRSCKRRQFHTNEFMCVYLFKRKWIEWSL